MERFYYVSPDRAALAVETASAALRASCRLERRDIAVYVGIPFCPTRCIYCSFVSEAVEKSRHLIEPYLQALEQEIHGAAEGLKRHPHRIRTVYIGGGTPTTLDSLQMAWLLDLLHRACFL